MVLTRGPRRTSVRQLVKLILWVCCEWNEACVCVTCLCPLHYIEGGMRGGRGRGRTCTHTHARACPHTTKKEKKNCDQSCCSQAPVAAPPHMKPSAGGLAGPAREGERDILPLIHSPLPYLALITSYKVSSPRAKKKHHRVGCNEDAARQPPDSGERLR